MKFHYIARTESGNQFETVIEERSESTANAEAKIEVEQWLNDEGEPISRLHEFSLVYMTP